MKKLFPLVLILAVTVPPLLWLLRGLRFQPDIFELAQSVGVAAGWSMIFVGIAAMLVGAALSGDKNRVYQGGFCALLGVAISTFSLPALIASLVLIGWLDHKGRPIL